MEEKRRRGILPLLGMLLCCALLFGIQPALAFADDAAAADTPASTEAKANDSPAAEGGGGSAEPVPAAVDESPAPTVQEPASAETPAVPEAAAGVEPQADGADADGAQADADADAGSEDADAADGESDDVTDWDYSKSKTATDLDENYQSEVTLTLPSTEEQLTTEICFVLDGSKYSNTEEKSLGLLSSLKEAIEKTGAKVQVDIVGFKRAAYDDGSYDLATQFEEIKAVFQTSHSDGTNIHAGLLLAQEVLARNSSIPNNRKYMILVSDGDTYLFCKDGDYNTPYTRSFISVEKAGGAKAYGGKYDESYWKPSAPYSGNVGRPSTGDVDSWNAYLADVAARNEESNGDSYDYIWYFVEHDWLRLTPAEVAADGFKTQPSRNEEGKARVASNIDMALLYATEAYKALDALYNCYSFSVASFNTADGGNAPFMDYLNNLSNGGTADFDSLQNEILYFLSAGSRVEDYMGYEEGGYNFDLVDPSKMTVVIWNDNGTSTTYEAVEIGGNHYGFKPAADESNYQYDYEVVYTPADDGTEHFVFTTNVAVSNFEHVSLHYLVQLMNPSTKAGTYGQKDLDGDGYVDGTQTAVSNGLYTNSQAVLYPVDSNGKEGTPSEFPKPSVSYAVTADLTLNYDANGGEGAPGDQSITTTDGNGTLIVSDETPTRNGYTFLGWADSSEATEVVYVAGDAIELNEDGSLKTLYAVWQKTYQVTYTDGVDGKEIFADQVYVVASGADTPSFEGTPTRKGYTFLGWTPEIADTVTGDVTYTAVWKKAKSSAGDDDDSSDSIVTTASAAIPKTADANSNMLYMALLMIASLGAAVVAMSRRRSARE